MAYPRFKFYNELRKAALYQNMKPCGQCVCAAEYGAIYKRGEYSGKALYNIDTMKSRKNPYSTVEKLRWRFILVLCTVSQE